MTDDEEHRAVGKASNHHIHATTATVRTKQYMHNRYVVDTRSVNLTNTCLHISEPHASYDEFPLPVTCTDKKKTIITKVDKRSWQNIFSNFLQNCKCKCAWTVPWQMQEKTCQVHDYNLPCLFYSVPLLSKRKLLSHKDATLAACLLARSTSQYIL